MFLMEHYTEVIIGFFGDSAGSIGVRRCTSVYDVLNW